MVLNLGDLPAAEALSAIYIGYFERAADPEGLDFWSAVYTSQALSLTEVATDFASQPEALDAFDFLSNPSSTSANDFITQVYLNLFNRPPDPAGRKFWSDVLQQRIGDDSGVDIGQIILEIVGGAQNSTEGNDLTTIQNKIEVAVYWTDAAEQAEVDYQNDAPARASANVIIADVTDDRNSVDSAKADLGDFIYFTTDRTEVFGIADVHDDTVPMYKTAAPALVASDPSESVALIGLTPSEPDV